ncbi:MAG: NYN domain-containing protein [Puniceicoccales bacterium]|jgi:predicted RNA-binding protein with PIN domain|nr:NYN domain-containing protein [Puniceicoccales bacterium]
MRWFLLDALNIIHGCPLFRDLLPDRVLAAGERLVDWVVPLAQAESHRVLVVFDGGAIGAVATATAVLPSLLLIHTPPGRSADGHILAALRRIRRHRWNSSPAVVSDDGALGALARVSGGEVLSVEAFFQKLQAYRKCQGERLSALRGRVEKSWPTIGDLMAQTARGGCGPGDRR